MANKSKPPSPPPPSGPGPFAALAELRDRLPPGAPAPPSKTSPIGEPRGPARAVVRYERAGRRGKEATVVEKLGLGAADLEAWCKALKQALGCGGTVDEHTIVLQGDQRTRIEPLLAARGVRKITIAG